MWTGVGEILVSQLTRNSRVVACSVALYSIKTNEIHALCQEAFYEENCINMAFSKAVNRGVARERIPRVRAPWSEARCFYPTLVLGPNATQFPLLKRANLSCLCSRDNYKSSLYNRNFDIIQLRREADPHRIINHTLPSIKPSCQHPRPAPAPAPPSHPL